MTARIVRVGKQRQLITTTFTPEPQAKDGLREHVTLATPSALTETARLRALSLQDAGKRWPQ